MNVNLLMILLNGITYAGLLFMVASGFTLVFGLMRVVNLAHGIFYLLAAYLGLLIYRTTGSWWLCLIGSSLIVAACAFVIHSTLLRRVQGDDQRETLLTLGISFVVGDLLLAYFGGMPQRLRAPEMFSVPVSLGILTYPGFRLFVLGIAVFIGVFLWALLKFTQLGRIIRAGVDDRDMVAVLGIDIDWAFVAVFVLAGFITGLSGVIGGSYLVFAPGEDIHVLTYSLIVVIVGGLGSLSGVALGALVVGLIDSFSKTLVPAFTMFFLFGTLMLVLAFRPHGLRGREK
ncbi:MAG: branched-chain amino acid ABC transporter permease [Spirochaetaceae bacterium]|nr:MAG: branched-chain amino acid ABC transporter permease [Spirochaetaceae bacterium]